MLEYHVAYLSRNEGYEVAQRILDDMARQGWQLVQTLQSAGYTVGLIFEREIISPM